MSNIPRLEAEFRPQELELALPEASMIDDAEEELAVAALFDDNGCMGYFPGFADRPDVRSDFPANKSFADAVPYIEAKGKRLAFNFTRLSLVRQAGLADFHLDSDAVTALTGDLTQLANRLVWRLLINLSPRSPRSFSYADVNVQDVPLRSQGNYLRARINISHQARRLVLPERSGESAHAVLFCSSRVLHSGRDYRQGHFIGAYGCEEPA